MYIVAGRPFIYDKYYEEQVFMNWLISIQNSTSTDLPSNGTEFNQLLNKISECTGERWLVLLNNNERWDHIVPTYGIVSKLRKPKIFTFRCPMPYWNNLARSMADFGNLTTARLNYETTKRRGSTTTGDDGWDPQPFNQVVIQQRLPNLDSTQCATLIVLQNNAYRRSAT